MNNNETNELIERLKQRRDEAVQQDALWTCSADELRAAMDAGLRDFRRANLTGANLTDANLADADLSSADMTGASLCRADLAAANLSSANLNRANLAVADLTGANLTDADLTGAILSGADMTDAILNRANLSGAILARADLIDADLSGADLRTAEGIMAVYLPDMSSRGDHLYLVRQHNCPARFKAGCQWLTRDELVTRVKEKKDGGSTGRDLYLLAIDFLAAAAQRLGWQI